MQTTPPMRLSWVKGVSAKYTSTIIQNSLLAYNEKQ